MQNLRSGPLLALIVSGVLWGVTVPLTKIALDGVGPLWLSTARFGLAAVPLLLLAGRAELRAALTPKVAAWGAAGYGGVIVLQGLGIARTSVAHASLIIGLVPVLGALGALALGRGGAGRTAWIGFGVAFTGIALVAAGGGGSATVGGDLLVLLSALLTAAFLLAQADLLTGRRPLAVTAVQFAAAALASAPLALVAEGGPALPAGQGPLLAVAGLIVGGTLVPFWLFAYAQAWVAPDLAGAFLNIEPVIGFALGVLAFGDPFGPLHVAGVLAAVTGLVLTALPPRPATAPDPASERRELVIPLDRAEIPLPARRTPRPDGPGHAEVLVGSGPPGHEAAAPRRAARVLARGLVRARLPRDPRAAAGDPRNTCAAAGPRGSAAMAKRWSRRR